MNPESGKSIRIASWNLGHQTRLADIHPRFLEAVRALNPDVLLLNEYVHDDTARAPLVKSLGEIGLSHHLVSEQVLRPAATNGEAPRRNNQVLAASRFPLRLGDLHGPQVADKGGEANFLHVIIDELSIEIVGIRVPAYDSATLLLYWDAFVKLTGTVVDRRICFIGDFNADPDRAIHVAAKRFSSLRDHGWKVARAEGNWSFKSGTRIDHALASPGFPQIAGAQYIASSDDLTLAGSSPDAISDHAALVIDFTSNKLSDRSIEGRIRQDPCALRFRKYERDIDLLLAEEFVVSKEFAAWFLEKTKFAGIQAVMEDVSVSKSDSTGESDLVVIYKQEANSGRFAIHIEDKIDAPLQPEQEARYRQRAESDVSHGAYDDFEIVLCAPEFYRANQPKAVGFDRFVSYEHMAHFIVSNDPSPRGQYRSNFLLTSTSPRINNWKKVDDEQTNSFWTEAYKMASREFPILEMKEPSLTKGATWINFRPMDMPTMPRRIYVSFKGDRGYMDLTFSNCVANEFERRIRDILAPNMTVHQTANSAAIRLAVNAFTVSEPLEISMAKVREAFSACETLINFYRNHRVNLMGALAVCGSPRSSEHP